jgi:hypothetical protein
MRNFMIDILTHYCAADKIEKNEMSEACSSDGDRRGEYRILVGKPVEKDTTGETQM